MTEEGAYLVILSLGLAVPIALAIKTLLALKTRVIVPLLRVYSAGGTTEAITRRGEERDAGTTERSRGYVIAAPTDSTPPRRTT
jgi:hypothetical protein